MTRRKPHEYNWAKAEFDETLLTKHFTRQSSRDVRFVVIHHMVIPDRDPDTDDALDACYDIWQTRRASAHYGVDGHFVRQYVWDKNEAWATGSNEGNDHGISIEHANLTLDEAGTERDYLIGDETLATSARLVAHLHVIHQLGRPSARTVRKHSSFFATACPGPHFDRIWSDYVASCARVYDEITGGSSGGTQSVPYSPKPAPAPKPNPEPAPKFVPVWTPTGNMTVKEIQRVVGVTADGLYGNGTRAAVREYQRDLGVAADGLWGPSTEAAHNARKRRSRLPKTLLRVGSRGKRVRRMQAGLNRAFPAYSKLAVDGIFGAGTARVIREFQRRSNLVADGVVGRKTRAALARYGIEA